MGSKYNHQGLFGEWWSAKAKDHINRQQQCLVEQFDRFGLDGEATLDHNFADLGAVSLLSDLLVEGLEELVPGLDGWTKQQLMYIQYARLKCSKTTKESRVSEAFFLTMI
jgi:predicted metalloendopeptidase